MNCIILNFERSLLCKNATKRQKNYFIPIEFETSNEITIPTTAWHCMPLCRNSQSNHVINWRKNFSPAEKPLVIEQYVGPDRTHCAGSRWNRVRKYIDATKSRHRFRTCNCAFAPFDPRFRFPQQWESWSSLPTAIKSRNEFPGQG